MGDLGWSVWIESLNNGMCSPGGVMFDNVDGFVN